MLEYKIIEVEKGDHTVSAVNDPDSLASYLEAQSTRGWTLASYDWHTWRRMILVREKRDSQKPTGAADYLVKDVHFTSYKEALDVLTTLRQLMIKGPVSVANFYEMVDIAPAFTDSRWGWSDLSDTGVSSSHLTGSYLIDLPNPHLL